MGKMKETIEEMEENMQMMKEKLVKTNEYAEKNGLELDLETIVEADMKRKDTEIVNLGKEVEVVEELKGKWLEKPTFEGYYNDIQKIDGWLLTLIVVTKVSVDNAITGLIVISVK